MPGVSDPLKVAPRTSLFDTLDVLREHRETTFPVGAQAVYFHTGATTLTVTEYTTNTDFIASPDLLACSPNHSRLSRPERGIPV